MKVVHFITDLIRGGESRLLLTLLPRLRAKGVDPVVVVLSRNFHAGRTREADLAGEFEGAGFRVLDLGARDASAPVVAVRLARVLRRERPDVLHTYLFHPNVMGRVVGRVVGVRRIVSSVVSVDDWKRPWHVALERATWRLADRFLVNADAIRARLVERERVDPARIVVAPNGVDVDAFAGRSSSFRKAVGLAEDAFVVGTVCRLHPAKGIPVLLDAFAILARARPDARLVVVGEGAPRADLEARRDALGLRDRVLFVGARDDVPDVLPAFDVFAISSLWEGIPGTIFEAQAAGLPVVATRVGGIPEAIADGEDGLLVPAGDAAALAGAFERVARDAALAARLAAAGNARVRRERSLDAMVERRLGLYRELA